MKEIMVSVEDWAKTLHISAEQYNELLGELGYQTAVKNKEDEGAVVWSLTEKGLRHIRMSRNPFRRKLRWDFETHFQVHKLVGRKTGKWIFCEKCDACVSRQPGFSTRYRMVTCQVCGYENELSEYQRSGENMCEI